MGESENEGETRESKKQNKRYASAGNRDSEKWSTWCMYVTKRKNKQTMQCILHRETIPLHASFTLLFVFIPSSISKTWLKCSSYQRLCWTMKKTQWDGKKNEAEKSKASFTAWRFSSFTGGEKKSTQTFKLFPLPHFPLSLSLPFSSAVEKPPDTWGQSHRITSSIAFPEQHFSHTFISKHWYNSLCSL